MKVIGRPVSKDAVEFEAVNVSDVEITNSYVCLVYDSEGSVPNDILAECDDVTDRRREYLVTFEGEYEVNVEGK